MEGARWGVANAQPKGGTKADEAIERYKQGVKLFEEQDFNAALIEFRKAYEMSPNFKVAFNIGQVYYQIQNYAKALQWFERYLNEGGKDVPADRRQEVTKEIGELKRRVGRVEIVTDLRDVEVSIDDEPVGKTPLSEPLVVSAGRRKISANKPGRSPFTQMVEIAGQETKKVQLNLNELSTAGPATGPVASTPAPPPPPKEKPSRMTTGSWVGLGVAGALGLGAGITGLLALGASSDVKSASYAGSNRDDVDSKNSKTKGLALATDVLLGAAVVTAGVTLVLTFTGGDSSASARRAAPKATLGLSPRGAWLQGEF